MNRKPSNKTVEYYEPGLISAIENYYIITTGERKEIKRMKEWSNVFYITFKTGRSTFISKKIVVLIQQQRMIKREIRLAGKQENTNTLEHLQMKSNCYYKFFYQSSIRNRDELIQWLRNGIFIHERGQTQKQFNIAAQTYSTIFLTLTTLK